MPDNRIVSYLKAGYLLHIITSLEVLLSCCLFHFADMYAWISNGHAFLKILALSPTVISPLFAQLDARSRYQNYKLIRDVLYVYGFQERIIKPFIKSRCQRDAVKAAAGELGMLHLCNEYFEKSGYRWYHILPDIVFDKPGILLTRNFWLTTIFEKTYHSKSRIEKHNLLIQAG